MGELPPRKLGLAVAAVAAAMLMLELTLTRVFSVLFFYHYSFFSISLAMSGLAIGGLLVSRSAVREDSAETVRRRLVLLSALFAAGIFAAALVVVYSAPFEGFWTPDMGDVDRNPSLAEVGLAAVVFLPGLVAAGAFLATAFAYGETWIGRLYAADLLGAAAICPLTILAMRELGGTGALFVPVLVAALASLVLVRSRAAVAVVAAALVLAGLADFAFRTPGNDIELRDPREVAGGPALELWNEHSRVRVSGVERPPHFYIVIDKAAATRIVPTRARAAGEPIPVEPWWDRSVAHLAYRLGRPLDRVAIIGVGGGVDLLAPLANGANQVDGYELNDRLIELLEKRAVEFNGIASWPEVDLIHSEARVGIRHAPAGYDVIQASMIDTWASTSSGGFVLSENGLYTREAWQTFLSKLAPGGVLTMTRWFVRDEPAEVQRLVSLAAAALEDAGVVRPRNHIALIASAGEVADAPVSWATILVSKAAFGPIEVVRLRELAERQQMEILALPGRTPADAVIDALLDPERRERAIADNEYDLSAPTDLRPYFFLQLRPSDLSAMFRRDFGFIANITFEAMSVMLLLAGLSLVFAFSVMLLAVFTLPSGNATPGERRIYRWMVGYFFSIGLGYIMIQLGLHQRLVLIVGHPTTTLATVLFAMLLGTGFGSAMSQRVESPAKFRAVWLGIVSVVASLLVLLPVFPAFQAIASPVARAIACGSLVAIVGFALGFAFPIGVRLVAPTGPWAVQKMWAVNGAASIAGTSAAALVGVGFGSQAVILAGLVFYAVMFGCGFRVQALAGSSG